jgi:hypothetical protein
MMMGKQNYYSKKATHFLVVISFIFNNLVITKRYSRCFFIKLNIVNALIVNQLEKYKKATQICYINIFIYNILEDFYGYFINSVALSVAKFRFIFQRVIKKATQIGNYFFQTCARMRARTEITWQNPVAPWLFGIISILTTNKKATANHANFNIFPLFFVNEYLYLYLRNRFCVAFLKVRFILQSLINLIREFPYMKPRIFLASEYKYPYNIAMKKAAHIGRLFRQPCVPFCYFFQIKKTYFYTLLYKGYSKSKGRKFPPISMYNVFLVSQS